MKIRFFKCCFLMICLSAASYTYAQDTPARPNDRFEQMERQMQQMQAQMRRQMQGFGFNFDGFGANPFGNFGNLDSLMRGGMGGMNLDSMMRNGVQGFSFFNDGSGWKQLEGENGAGIDTTFTDENGVTQRFRFFGNGASAEELQKMTERMFRGHGDNQQNDGETPPPSTPRSNDQKGDADMPKKKKYKTQTL